MICPKCHIPLEIPSNVCPNCGAGLQRSGGRVLVVASGLVMAIVIGVYGYLSYRFSAKRSAAQISAVAPALDPTSRSQAPDSPGLPPESDPSPIAPLPVSTGELTLWDVAAGKLGTYPAAVVSSGWFAFPRQMLIGAYAWQVALEAEPSFPVEGGIMQDEDPVGLWQVSANLPLAGLDLAPWERGQPLHWYPLEEDRPPQILQIRSVERLGNFDRIPFDTDSAGQGVFIQDGAVVGWSFGAGFPGGFLWTGRPGSELIPEFYTEDFYRLTFEGGREEAILLAFAAPDLSDLQRLAALAEAHRLEARMPLDQIPDRIAPAQVHEAMRRLVEALRSQGRAEALIALFDPQTLAAVNHPPLAGDLASAARDAGDYDYALSVLEMLVQAPPGEAQHIGDAETMQAAVYRDWLNHLIAEGDQEASFRLYQEASTLFPQDPTIHLAGVELALQRSDWSLAERLLAARSYPNDLRDRVSRLQREITDLKSQAGKIIIRFRPGALTVPVTATVGGRIEQRFLIDTGASVVTVPSETAHRLRIDLSGSLPRRLFYSSTGVQNAVEITLPSIELNGWVIEDIDALVVDLPGQPGVGLLGMTYLNHFRLDLNTEEGLLVLAPR